MICNVVPNLMDLFGLARHHIIPQSLWGRFAPALRSFLDQQVIQTTTHNYTRHGFYNTIIRNEIIKRFPQGITNTEEFQDILLFITKDCKFTKGFNRAVAKGPVAVAEWFNSQGYKYVPPELQAKAVQALKHTKFPNGKLLETISKNTAKKLLLGLSLVNAVTMRLEGANNDEIALFLYDDLTFGVGEMAINEYWEFANNTANWIVKQNAFPWLKEDFLAQSNFSESNLSNFDKKDGNLRVIDYLETGSWWMSIIQFFTKGTQQ